MKLCYIDESGDGRRPDPQTANVTPLIRHLQFDGIAF